MLVIGINDLTKADVPIAITGIVISFRCVQSYGAHRTGVDTGHTADTSIWIILAFLILDSKPVHRTDLLTYAAANAVFIDVIQSRSIFCQFGKQPRKPSAADIFRCDETSAVVQVFLYRGYLRIGLFIRSSLLLDIRFRQKIVCHPHHIDIGRSDPQALSQVAGLPWRIAISASVSEDDVEICCVKPGVSKKRSDQFRHPLYMNRTDDADLPVFIGAELIMDGLRDAYVAWIKLFCYIQTVSCGRKVKQHCLFHLSLTAENMGH